MGRWSALFLAVVSVAGCRMQNPTAPVPQPDTVIFGRLASIREVADQPGVREVEVQGGLPESIAAVMRSQGRPVPQAEKDFVVVARVTGETVAVLDQTPTDLAGFRTGEEVAIVPVPGTSAMVGSKRLLMEAAELYRFKAYQRVFLPGSLSDPEAAEEGGPAGPVNGSGLERTPLPLDGGRVVYFAAGLAAPLTPEGPPRGLERPGMRSESGLAPWAVGGWRPYRVEWRNGAWGEPEPVELAPLDPAASVRITWIDAAETRLLAEVDQEGAPARLVTARRGSRSEPWGALEDVGEAAGDSVGDGQLFGTSAANLVWTVYGDAGSDLWLEMAGSEGQPLEPRINTRGSEWAPRVGPGTILYFCRNDRQLLFAGGVVQEVRLPGAQRYPLLEAAPAGGSLLFFRAPRYGVGGVDWNLAVSQRDGDAWGPAVLLDDWSPVTPS